MFCEKFKFGKSSFVTVLLTGAVLTLSLGLMACSTAAPPQVDQSIAPSQSPPIASTPGQILPITATTQLGEKKFQLEVAQTPEQQAMGLMYRPALGDDRGMLFPMGESRRVSFWMRNVPVALDIVFINKGNIVAIAAKVPPCTTPSCPTYGPKGYVDQVLELRAGRAEELGLKAGDPVVISALK
jgi:uncharacterized protein